MSGGWQQTLTDEDSQFLRGVNEGYRTWCLRNQKIQWLLRALESIPPQDYNTKGAACTKVDMRVQQLKAMTIGQVEDEEDETPKVFKECEEEITLLQKLLTSPKEKEQLNFHFDNLSLADVDQSSFEKEFKDCLIHLGASQNLVSSLVVQLMEGSIIAGVTGPPAFIHDLRKLLRESKVVVMGDEARIAEVQNVEQSEMEATDCFSEEESILEGFRLRMHALDNQVETIMDNMITAEFHLKGFERDILSQWQEKKNSSEYWSKRYAALTGMRSAMRAVLQRYEQRFAAPPASPAIATALPASTVENVGSESGACTTPAMLELLPRKAAQGSNGEAQEKDEDLLVDQDDDGLAGNLSGPEAERGNVQRIHALSDVLAEGATDPREREEILKREHAGSAEHPHGCRPCHFQGGLCWKGLSCSFCHICPKPKRKSKHQRDVDKRRQERYRQVKDDLGVKCLDELTKVDDSRRQIMTSSEEMKKCIKDAYSSGDLERIEKARRMVEQIKQTVSDYHAAMPPELTSGGPALQETELCELDALSDIEDMDSKQVDDEEGALQIGMEHPGQSTAPAAADLHPRQAVPPEAEDAVDDMADLHRGANAAADDVWDNAPEQHGHGVSPPGKAKGPAAGKSKGRGRSSGRGKYGQPQYPAYKGEMEGGKPWQPYYPYPPPYDPYWQAAWGKKGLPAPPAPAEYWKGKPVYPGPPYPGQTYEWGDPAWSQYPPGPPAAGPHPGTTAGWQSDPLRQQLQ